MDPMIVFTCYAISFILAVTSAIREKRQIRYIAVFISLVSLILLFQKAPDAVKHYERYLNKKTGVLK